MQFSTTIDATGNAEFPPIASVLRIDSFNGCPYSWRWSVGFITETRPATPAVPAVGVPGDEDYVAEIPARDAETVYAELCNGNTSMTVEQFDEWTTQDAGPYLLGITAENLGLKIVTP